MGLERWTRLAEIDANVARFIQLLPVLVPAHQGQCVLMRHREAVGASVTAHRFRDGMFSVQRIGPAPEEDDEPTAETVLS